MTRKDAPFWTHVHTYDVKELQALVQDANLESLDFNAVNETMVRPPEVQKYRDHIRGSTKSYFDYEHYSNLYVLEYNPEFQFRSDLVSGVISDLFVPTVRPMFRGTFLERFVEQLKGEFKAVDKVYVARMEPNTEIKWHIDFATEFTSKIHVPLVTEPQCVFGFRLRKNEVLHHFPADGNAWDLNVSVPHAVFHRGTIPRLHLIAEVHK